MQVCACKCVSACVCVCTALELQVYAASLAFCMSAEDKHRASYLSGKHSWPLSHLSSLQFILRPVCIYSSCSHPWSLPTAANLSESSTFPALLREFCRPQAEDAESHTYPYGSLKTPCTLSFPLSLPGAFTFPDYGSVCGNVLGIPKLPVPLTGA